MTEKYLLTILVERAERMREYQKAFFAAREPEAKRHWLAKSKVAERFFDETIKTVKTAQANGTT